MGQEGQLDYLGSRMDILDGIDRIARGVDRLDRAIFRTGYQADAILDCGTHIGNPEQHMDFFFALHAAMQKAHAHTICNHTCELDGDVAHAETYFIFGSQPIAAAFALVGHVGRDRDDVSYQRPSLVTPERAAMAQQAQDA